jgi:acyl-CoA dehydrogenase
MWDAVMSDRQELLRKEVQDFVRWVPRDLLLAMDADEVRYPREFVQEAARRELLGLRFPPAYGGRGLGWTDEIIALEEIGVLGASLACLYSLVTIVGEAINVFGTEEQKARYLVPLLRGELFCAEALTEPRGGSDFFGATATAERQGDSYVLNGQKRFIVGAEGADLFLVYARTSERGISAFLVEREMGVQTKYLYGLMGTRGGGAGRILLHDVRVPGGNLLWGEDRGKEIFYQMMVPERMTTAAGALGLARAALEIALRYSDRRKAFGRPIREFEGVSFKIADGITQLDAARGLVRTAASAADTLEGRGTGLTRRLVSEAKKFATEAAWAITNDAMQILGGIGYTNIYPVERMVRDARLMMIWTGTNEIMNLIIQHEYYREVLGGREGQRDSERDAAEADAEEDKIYE